MAATDLTALGIAELTGPAAPPAREVLRALLDRIQERDPRYASVLELAPAAMAQARACDADRGAGRLRGPLHGVPFLVKGNIDVAGSTLRTTAGSMALADVPNPRRDAPLLSRLRAAGAVLVGTANLSEWANFRSTGSSSGWSAMGGQCRNAYLPTHSPGGSSAGSAVAVAARFVPFAIGTETDGSILCPASLNGVVGLKPTLGAVPGDGIIPIARSQDVAGPVARTVADAAAVFAVLSGTAPPDLSCRALAGVRLGVPREVYCGYDADADAALETALSACSRLGAQVVDPAPIATAAALRDEDHELTVLLCEFLDDLADYLRSRPGGPRRLSDVIAFNRAHPETELAYFDQDLFERAAATGGRADPAYRKARSSCLRLARTEGIDATLGRYELDALILPTYPPAWPIGLGAGGDGRIAGSGSTPTAVAGYPAVTVPAGQSADGRPLGVMFAGPAGTDSRLLGYAHALEQALGPLPAPTD